MMRRNSFIIYTAIFVLVSVSAWSQEVSTTGFGGRAMTIGGGGTNSGGGQGVQTDEFTGATTYSLTIPVPPARGEVEPNLVLNYNSHRRNPNSWVGYGWELDMGSIIRTPEEGVIDYGNGTSFEARFGGQAETLIRIQSDVSPSSYGLTIEGGSQVDLYQAQNESAFNLYFHLWNDEEDHGWMVVDKGGRRYRYGSSSVSREETRENGEHWVARWLLDSITDANGNEVIVNYGEDLLPDFIQYQDIALVFTKVSAGNFFPVFRQGFLNRYQLARQLRAIEIQQLEEGSWQRLQRFELQYEAEFELEFIPGGVQFLQRVTQFGQTDAQSLPPTTFEYYKGATGFSSTRLTRQASRGSGDNRNLGFLGDTAQLADMNGDGQPDQIVYVGGNEFNVYYGNGSDFVALGSRSVWPDPFPCGGGFECEGKLEAKEDGHQWLFLMDMNGDTLPDRVGRRVASNNSSRADFVIAFNTGRSFSSTLTTWRDPYEGSWAGTSDKDKGFFDMNGDGLIDRVIGSPNNGGFYVHFNTGRGFERVGVFWRDPLTVLEPNHSARGKIYEQDDRGIYITIRDLNGDGLPDRIWRSFINTRNDAGEIVQTNIGFAVHLNRNGIGWGEPTPCPEEREDCVLVDTSDNLAIQDPVFEEEWKGYFNNTHDWIDMNGDGYLDRVAGDREEGRFRVYYYEGLNPTSNLDYLTTVYFLEDPVRDDGGEWNAQGFIAGADEDRLHTFIRDMNGDGYPDRVTIDRRSGDNEIKYFHIYPMRSNAIGFDDTPSQWVEYFINQPNKYLKDVDEGNGSKMAMEYIPSSLPLRWGAPGSWPNGPTHRFLPINLYVVRKLFTRDTSLGWNVQTVEGERHPGMRYTTYSYYGGNLYIRYATVRRSFYSRFNGFQAVVKEVARGPGETWRDYQEWTRYHQAEGDVDSFLYDSDASVFDADGYAHFSLSGKPYEHLIAELPADAGHLAVREESTWRESRAAGGDLFRCNDYCYPQLASRHKIVWEEASALRSSRVDYQYDDTGNITLESHFDRSGNLLLEKETTYYPVGDFDLGLQMRDRPHFQRKKLGEEVFREKEFVYDPKGNPTQEKFTVDQESGEFVTIDRVFYTNGNLWQITDVDGITKTLSYDGFALFPTTEVASSSGVSLETRREFHRQNGQVTLEIGPQGSGTRVTYDDFGRPTSEYIVATSGTETLTKQTTYSYVSQTVGPWSDVPLLSTTVWEPMPDYPDTNLTPSQYSYTDVGGQVLQSCLRSESGSYRRTLARLRNGGRRSVQSEPVYTSDCNFVSDYSASRSFRTDRDLLGKTTYVEPPSGDAGSPVASMTIQYTNMSDDTLRKRTTAGGRTKDEFLDEFERIVRIRDPMNSEVRYNYNPVGDLRQVLVGGESVTTIDYDLLGRKTEMTDADMGTWSYDYDDFGRLERQTDNKGQKIEYDYTSLGRIERKEIYDGEGNLERYETYTYDDGSAGFDVRPGELFQVEEFDAEGTSLSRTRFGYDALYRRVSRIARNIPGVAEFEQTTDHHPRGLVRSTQYPSGSSLFYQYSRTGSIEKICSESSCNSASGEVYYSVDPNTGYDVFGAILREGFGNGVAGEYEYFPNSHRLQSKRISRGGDVYSNRTYTYDVYSNITQLGDPLNSTGSGGLASAGYDTLNRLTSYRPIGSATSRSLTYDFKGNMLTNSASFGAEVYQYESPRPHAVTRIGDKEFEYDENGNMTRDPSRQMTYNAQNQLAQVTMTSGVIVDYDYDYTGARVSKKVTRQDTLGRAQEATTHYLGDALEIRGDRLLLHIHAGGTRIATKSLGSLEVLGGGAAGSTFIDRGIRLPFRLAHLIPYLSILFALLLIASFRPVGPPALSPLPFACPERSRRIRGGLGWGRYLPLFRLWRSWCLTFQEAVFDFPRRRAFKLVSIFLIFLFVIQYPIFAMADHRGVPESVRSDQDFFIYHHGDHLGSSHIVTEGKVESRHSGVVYRRGQLLQRFEYTPFGQETFVLNPNLKFDPSYTGQIYDIESGLYYYKSRYYDPQLGRFIQPDTVVPDAKNLQAYNRYTYVNNNPLKYVDPTGHFWGMFKKIMVAFVVAAIGVAVGVLTAGILPAAMAPLLAGIIAGAAGGLAGGAIGGAISGGLRGALMGAALGLAGGAVFGGVGPYIGAIGKTIMAGAGAGLSYAQGGWKGLVIFGAGLAGAYAGKGIGESIAGGEGGTGIRKDQVAEIEPDEQWVNPTGGGIRGQDDQGSGEFFLAARKGGGHGGLDLTSTPGQPVRAPFSGALTVDKAMQYKGLPYADIQNARFTGRLLYLQKVTVQAGSFVQKGQIIGFAADITGIPGYQGITNHIHFQVKLNETGKFVNPTRWIFP